MGRGKLTHEEIKILKENPYVQDVNENRVLYTDEFKKLFIEEYFNGKKPMTIFVEAGFDVGILGSKRIERASARWREANASGSLAEKNPKNDFYRKTANRYTLLKDKIKSQEEEISRLNTRIAELESLLEGKQHIETY